MKRISLCIMSSFIFRVIKQEGKAPGEAGKAAKESVLDKIDV